MRISGITLVLSFLLWPLSLSAQPIPLAAGCYSGVLSKGSERGTTVTLQLSSLPRHRYRVRGDSGGLLFGRQCAGEESTSTRFRVRWNRELKRYVGSEGEPCDFVVTSSTIHLSSAASGRLRFKREVRGFIGAGGGGFIHEFSSGVLDPNDTACIEAD